MSLLYTQVGIESGFEGLNRVTILEVSVEISHPLPDGTPPPTDPPVQDTCPCDDATSVHVLPIQRLNDHRGDAAPVVVTSVRAAIVKVQSSAEQAVCIPTLTSLRVCVI